MRDVLMWVAIVGLLAMFIVLAFATTKYSEAMKKQRESTEGQSDKTR
jgi:hypothetical protein